MAFLLLCGVGGVLGAGLLAPVAAGANIATDSVVTIFNDLPDELTPDRPSEASYIYYSDGTTLMAKIYAQNRVIKPLDQIAPILQDAVIAIEDRRYYQHGAVDFEGTSRAAVTMLTTNDTQGGSTLTQQYVKNVLIEKAVREDDPIASYEAAENSLARKAREARLAIALEEKLSKEEILEGYLNIAQFGRSVYGVEAAAQQYFGVSAADLNYLQAATIAGITREPSRYDPSVPKNLPESQKRRNLVLQAMLKQKNITQEEYDTGRATPIEDTLNIQQPKVGCESAGDSAFFCSYLVRTLTERPELGATADERKERLYTGGLTIVSSLDVNMQAAAVQAARGAVPIDDPSGLEDAVVSVQPGTGYIRAMTQNRPFSANGSIPGSTPVNYSTDQAHGGSRGFSPGSTWKAFTLTEWLRSGHTLNQSVNADQREFTPKDFRPGPCRPQFAPWKPGNSDGSTDKGSISVLAATYNSVNTAYVTMESQVDMCALRDTAWDVGFRPSITKQLKGNSESIEVVPSMTIGTQNSSPLAMAAAYATFASGGTRCDPLPIVSMTSGTGEDIPIQPSCTAGAIPANVANTVTFALSQVLPKGQGQKVRGLADGRPSAGKTGTAQMNRHTWFVGFTPQLSTAVWIGNAENDVSMQSMTINGKFNRYWYGSSLAAPTWAGYMNTVLAGQPIEQFGAPDPALIGSAPAPKPQPDATKPQGGPQGGQDTPQGQG